MTCDRVTVLALCTFSDGRLSMYQVSINPLLHFQRYASVRFLTAKIKKGSKSVNAGDRVIVLAFCNSPHGHLSVYQVSFNYLHNFRDMLRTKVCWTDGRNSSTMRLRNEILCSLVSDFQQRIQN